ncbi:MAG: YihY/virulence factor BrkB family protein [Bacteroidota bacterium]|nr:YihY/virulence factor BrkB family protein [Bacteroidota bacterium]
MLNKIFFLQEFLTKGIWSLRLSELPERKARVIKAIRIFLIGIRGVNEDQIQHRASALTLYSITSVVPVLAMGFGIAKGFGFDKKLEKLVYEKLEGYEDLADKLITFSHSMLQKTQGGLIAGVGLAVLFYTVMKVFSNIETSFNDIWQVKKHRSYVRKFSDYLSLMLISPLFFISANAINIYIYQMVLNAQKHANIVSLFSPFLFVLLKLLPFLLIILLFTSIYIIMPNTRVKFRAALVGGILAGTAFQLTQWAYIHFQVGVSNYNAIYGSFAALPLFIIWIQISWLIVLFGAKLCYATQHLEMYEFETETVQMSDYSRRIVGLLVAHRIIHNFKEGEPPLTAHQLSQDLKIPIRMIKMILSDLVKTSIVSEVLTNNPQENAFQPAQYIERYSIKYIIEKLDRLGEDYLINLNSETTHNFIQIHDKFFKNLETMPENVLIKDI